MIAAGLYASQDAAVLCACGHLDLDHERRGFKKPCLHVRCSCGDLDTNEGA